MVISNLISIICFYASSLNGKNAGDGFCGPCLTVARTVTRLQRRPTLVLRTVLSYITYENVTQTRRVYFLFAYCDVWEYCIASDNLVFLVLLLLLANFHSCLILLIIQAIEELEDFQNGIKTKKSRSLAILFS